MTQIASIAYPIKKAQEAELLTYLNEIIVSRTNMSTLRAKYELCDRLVSREPKQGTPRLEITAPIIMPQCDTMVSYLTSIFLNTPEIFPVTTTPDAQETADAVNALFKRFAQDWKWKRNLLLCFKDASKYGLMAAECTWKTSKVGSLGNDVVATGAGNSQRVATETKKEGFSITNLDLYNTFWDTSVSAAMLAEEGEFAGYFEKKSTIQLHKYLLSLPATNGWNHRLKDIKASQNSGSHYYTPNVVDYDPVTGVTNWDAHFASLTGAGGCTNSHEVTTFYCRIVPADFGLDVPAKGTPQIWKFVVVNMQFIVYAECKSNAHDYLPIILGQPFESNLQYQQKALPEELASIQDFCSKLWSAEIASNRRIVANREIYNPSLVRSEDINNASESAKIALRNAAYGQDIRQAVYSIPYNDPAIGTRSSLAQGIAQFASLVTGQNQVSNGQFIKGNKTNDQFNEVLSRSDARQVAMAVLLEDQFFGVLKHVLLYDLLQYQQPMEVFDLESKSVVSVSPESFLDTSIQFTINDSLSIGQDSISPDAVMTLMQAVQSNEQLAQQYDTGKLFAMLGSKLGVKHLEKLMVAAPPQAQAPIDPATGQPMQVPQAEVAAETAGMSPEEVAAAANSPIDQLDYQQQMQAAIAASEGAPQDGTEVPPA